MSSHVSGFVTILGRPNSGKSTLLNALLGVKVAIVADKPQTTRTAIQGVVTLPEGQIVFVDTPGIHKADTAINKRMMDSVRASLDSRDLLLYLHDATQRIAAADRHALDLLKRADAPAILVLNKVDLVREKAAMLPLLERLQSLHGFVEYIPVSALTGDGLDRLRAAILSRLPEGSRYFPEDYITDQPERFLAAELIREKILRETRQEVPHSVAVAIESWEETPRLTRIHATILVEKQGQRVILIGKKGAMLKAIGSAARQEMEALFDRKIFLEMYVKVKEGWRENPAFLNALDWRTMAGSDDT